MPPVSRASATAPASTLPGSASARWTAPALRSVALGLLGVAIFALTLPMTRLAVGPVEAPQLPPAFVTAGRAAVAGLLSALVLLGGRVAAPPRAVWRALAVSALGTVLGFPLLLALALREVPAVHAAVITGVLPLATAVVAAWAGRQRASAGFWICALLGCGLVVGYAAWHDGGAGFARADALLLGAVAAGAIGYVAGARAAAVLPAPQVICWVLVGSLPLTLPAALATWPADGVAAVRPAAWAGFAYVAVFSMWLGFFAWYRALALGGVLRISQLQLLQPFLSLLFAAALLGEPLQASTLVFTLAVMAVVLVGRRARVG